MPRKAYNSPSLKAIGPYSHATDAQGLLFLSGQTPVDPATGKVVEGGVKEQTLQCFKNLFQVLKDAGSSPDEVQKVMVYLTDLPNDFPAMNEVYKEQFAEPYPSRTTVGVASLPMGVKVEIEVIARRKNQVS